MRPFADYIDKKLKKQTAKQRFINTILHQILPQPLNQHVWVAKLDNGVLSLLTDSPSWATQIRYQQHEIIKQLNSDPSLKLNKIEISIARSIDRSRTTTPQPKTRLSVSAKQAIKSATTTLSDPELKAIFEKISKR